MLLLSLSSLDFVGLKILSGNRCVYTYGRPRTGGCQSSRVAMHDWLRRVFRGNWTPKLPSCRRSTRAHRAHPRLYGSGRGVAQCLCRGPRRGMQDLPWTLRNDTSTRTRENLANMLNPLALRSVQGRRVYAEIESNLDKIPSQGKAGKDWSQGAEPSTYDSPVFGSSLNQPGRWKQLVPGKCDATKSAATCFFSDAWHKTGCSASRGSPCIWEI